MANVLTVPNSGIISFNNTAYSDLTVPDLSASARISYDNGGGINIASYTTATTALDRFTVDGTQGRLFSVSDVLTGTLFSVNDITGLPILEVTDNDTVIAGAYNTNALVVSGTSTSLGMLPLDTQRLSVSGDSTFIGNISSTGVIYASGSNSNEWNQTLSFTQSSDNLVISSGNSVSLNAYMQKPQITSGTRTTNIQLSGTNRFQWFIFSTLGSNITVTLPTVGTGAQINDVIILEGGGSLFNGSITSSGTYTNKTITKVGENYRWRYYVGGTGAQWYLEQATTSHRDTHASTGSDPITPGSILALPLSGGTLTGGLTVSGNISSTGVIYASGSNSDEWRNSKTITTFTATQNQPPATSFATLDTRNSIAVLDFDSAAVESAIFLGVIPEVINLTSGLAVYVTWMASTATSGNVQWRAEWMNCNTTLDSDSFDTAVESTGTANGVSGVTTKTLLSTTNIDGLVAGDMFRLRISRVGNDGTNDTMTGDAELIAVEVRSAA